MCVIAKKFGFEWPVSEYVKQLDTISLYYEWNNNVLTNNCRFADPKSIKIRFIDQFKILKST